MIVFGGHLFLDDCLAGVDPVGNELQFRDSDLRPQTPKLYPSDLKHLNSINSTLYAYSCLGFGIDTEFGYGYAHDPYD